MSEQDPIATIVQCHKCHKRLKYSGKKPSITCPGCGENVPIVDNIQEVDVHEVHDSPPVHGQSGEVNWQVSRGHERFGPFSKEQVLRGIAGGRIAPSDLLWNPSMGSWQSASALFPGKVPPDLPPPSPVFPGSISVASTPYSEFVAKKIPAGICGIFFGAFGVHKFIIGNKSVATMMLCISIAGIIFGILWLFTAFAYLAMCVIGIIEGITYLTCSDADFYKKYYVEKKDWF